MAAVEKPPHATATYVEPIGGGSTVIVGGASSPLAVSAALAQHSSRPSVVKHAA